MEFKRIIREHIKWRHQIFKLAKSDLRKTYSGAALGWSWAVIKPAVTIFVYWFAFSVGLRQRAGIEGFPFFLWLIAGIVPWFYISEMWSGGPNAMRRYKFLITKMKFPTSTIPTFVSMSKLTVHFVLIVIVILIYLTAGYGMSIYYLQIPFYMFMMFIMATGWTLIASVMGAMSKDFGNLVKSFTQALFWFSGIMWPVSNIENIWGKRLLLANPVTYIVEGYRNCFIHHKWFWETPGVTVVYICELAFMWILAIWAYKNLKKEMPDVL